MDILIKLRLYLWLMVLSLWGIMIYQFMEDDAPELPKMQWVSRSIAPQAAAPGAAAAVQAAPVSAAKFFPQKPGTELFTEPGPAGSREPENAERLPSSVISYAKAPMAGHPPSAPVFGKGALRPPSVDAAPKPAGESAPMRAEAPPPKGFVKTQTRHFVVYAETFEASSDFLSTIENIHANLMLDLASFSPWARDEKVSIFLFRTQETYRKVTGRPSWSGGASSVKSRKVYVYESPELVGILAHELCHIYFDSFFIGGKPSQLWLSEGMATLVQTERGLAAPNWLKENMEAIRQGKGYGLTEMMTVENTTGADDPSVRLWYTQAYSVVRFLIRAQYRSSFYRFCSHLKEGYPAHEALYRAYGMPFTRVKALEYAWRYDLQSGHRAQ